MNNQGQQLEALKNHCAFVFDVLIAKLAQKVQPAWPENLADFRCPLFVTYYKGEKKHLRGCIGTFA